MPFQRLREEHEPGGPVGSPPRQLHFLQSHPKLSQAPVPGSLPDRTGDLFAVDEPTHPPRAVSPVANAPVSIHSPKRAEPRPQEGDLHRIGSSKEIAELSLRHPSQNSKFRTLADSPSGPPSLGSHSRPLSTSFWSSLKDSFRALVCCSWCRPDDESEVHVRITRDSRGRIQTKLISDDNQEYFQEYDSDDSDEHPYGSDQPRTGPESLFMNVLKHRKSQNSELNSVMAVLNKTIQELPPDFSELYLFVGLLGYGGNGFVAEATERANGSKVAIKFIPRKNVAYLVPSDDSRFPKGIPLEAHILKSVSHPNVVRFRGLWMTEHYYCLVMDQAKPLAWRLDETPPPAVAAESPPQTDLGSPPSFPALSPTIPEQRPPGESVAGSPSPLHLETQPAPHVTAKPAIQKQPTLSRLQRPRNSHAGDLGDFLTMYGVTPVSVQKHLFRQVCEAYEAIHRAGYAYLDFRCENILVDDDFKITLIDFGMSHFLRSQVGDTFFEQYGTREASAPEIIVKSSYLGHQGDIWALGLILFRIASGGEACFINEEEVLSGLIPFPRGLHPDCADLLKKMLALEPAQRATISQVLSHPWLTNSD
ncbi:uncharacterized protein BJ171DRAFT_440235 [Polychytrium aggregatum]|uniref:uncharacterized protein n=1 Tax=Polychytrium aggregatum TaxID=110093 RepID=UPI0022FDE55F|nr:uncharacterized protein BJ171DRAFT_440235 [Polychytrium aggregatum]KAI9206729.1 hypothetical protein BJ171DRAFT_440235 [Polychytrium aggregatum]